MSQFAHDNPLWQRVFEAVETLHQTLNGHGMLLKPDIAHDYAALQEALAELGGDNHVAQYWGARKQLILRASPEANVERPSVTVQVQKAFYRQACKAD